MKRFAAVLVIQCVSLAQGSTTVYDNGAPLNFYGQLANDICADTFSLPERTNVEEAAFWTGHSYASDPFPRTEVNYWIYADAAGTPGATLLSGAGFTRNILEWSYPDATYRYRVEIIFPQPFVAEPGETYWMGFQVTGAKSRFILGSTPYHQGSSYVKMDGFPWEPRNFEFAFKLSGSPVPEPSACALFAIGAYALKRRSFRPANRVS